MYRYGFAGRSSLSFAAQTAGILPEEYSTSYNTSGDSQGKDTWWPWPFVMGCALTYAVFGADLESVPQISCGLLCSELHPFLSAHM
ncbi:hypothetical protein Y032_0102g3435 [Ancylostoma ceylanicum]|uniref:Uncharacterized protein n=1 Tax=Ancylostoma ceylanicum TaxID=53326 RepID=A0A016TH94_9BILA|nr:hypothetical protein Y032_0102g3435 [Ancylostoma ceylanicum]